MMRDDIDVSTAAEFQKPALAPIGLVQLDCVSGMFRMWTGFGELNWNGYVWYGAGAVGSIGAMEETTETRAAGVELTLSSISHADGSPNPFPVEILEIANSDGGAEWHGREARIYYAVMDDHNRLVGEPFMIRRGIMDVMTLTEGDHAEIKLQIEPRDIDLGRAKSRRYTAEDQRGEYPGDAGCDQVASLQNKTFTWMEGPGPHEWPNTVR